LGNFDLGVGDPLCSTDILVICAEPALQFDLNKFFIYSSNT